MAGALAQRPGAADTPAPDGGLAAGEYSHRQILVILSGLILGMFLASLDQTVVSTSIYKIGQSLHGLTAQAWVTTAFLITSTIATPLYGKLGDMYGRKPFYLAAIAIFVVGSIACSFATSMYMLAAFRAFQGIGAGGLSRSRWPSPATSSRRVSAPSTRAISSPSSAPRACSARWSAARSPGRTRCSVSTAGAGSSC
jgi:MFS family permease